jgi:filamentous hemagglutinin family protein
MGPAGPLSGPDFTIADTLGTTQGTNLFHSFSAFSIDSTESATFTGPAGLDNVISRVTGGTPSSIDGLFRSTVPGADVYFINPAGVIFGQNASLDVPAAFHTTTADELRFADGNVFSASNPLATVLTAAAPSAFGFLGPNPAGITLNDSALETATGNTLSLVGGDITVNGTDRNRTSPHLGASGGTLNLVSAASAGDVTIAGDTIHTDDIDSLGSIRVIDGRLDVSGSPSGDVYIEGGNIVIDSSHIWSDNSGPSNGGGISLKGESITVSHEDIRVGGSIGRRQPRLRAETYDSGDGGVFEIQAVELILDGGVRIHTGTGGTGRGGDIIINVERFEAYNTGRVAAFTWGLGRGSGRGGDVLFEASTVRMSGLYDARLTGVGAESEGDGRGGDVFFRADSIELIERGFINSGASGAGDAGNVRVEADSILLNNESGIQSANFGDGDSGNVDVIANRIVVANDGPGFMSTILTHSFLGPGDVGDLTIRASTLEVRRSSVGSFTLGSGSAGDTRIYVDSLLLDGEGRVTPETGDPAILFDPAGDPATLFDPFGFTTLGSDSRVETGGPAGDVEIVADSIVVRGGASIGSGTAGDSPGGNIEITANQIRIETQARIDAATVGSGTAGSITLNTTDLILSEGGRITASSSGSGLAGDITVNAANSIRISDGSVTTEALMSDGGNITLNAITMVDLLSSSVTTSVGSGTGAGGNINIDPQFVIVQNSNIIANAFGGPGGNINIVAGRFLIDPSSTVSASSALGIDGIINVDSPVADVTSGVTELPANVLDASTLVQAPCAARTGGGTSSLTSAGRSGLPAGPDGYLPSPGIALETGTVSMADSTNVPVPLHNGMNGGSVLLLAMSGLGCS